MSEQARHHSVPPMLTHSDSLDNDLDLEPKPLPRELINGLREIYKLFLRPDAEYELNLSHQVRRNVLQQFEQNDLTADILQPAVTEILMLMYLNTYPRFLDWIDRQGSKNHISRRGSSKCWSLNSSVVGRKTRAAFGVDSDELRSGLALRMAKENGW
ncbi:hypothetical protein BDF19DRAFT_431614 [Syncephalis fuscata]|nr:hypothetical protein BDF19DRAFT_431614 [Syncephalis fuscata]